MKIDFIEIAPRDGFQSVEPFIDTKLKMEIIDKLVDAGVKNLQITSFISPKAIPQMRDASEITKYVLEKYPKIRAFALTPNLKGVENAYKSGLRELTYVISLSESHNKANVNRSVDESIKEFEYAVKSYPDIKFNLDIATAFGCPFEGISKIEDLIAFVEKVNKFGVSTFDICDTTGMAYPSQVRTYLTQLIKKFPDCEFGIHIHDTRNMGILNTYEAIKAGATRIFSVCSGLGGCPFAPGASGNTASEDLLYMLKKEGYDFKIDVNKMIDTAKFIRDNIPEGQYSSHQINISTTN